MLTYTYVTPDGSTKIIKIKLLNTNFVTAWKEYFCSIVTNVPNIKFFGSGINYNSDYLESDELSPFLIRLYKSFCYFDFMKLEDFKSVMTVIEHLVRYPEQVNQSHLNKWHRIFTKLEEKYVNIPKSKFPEYIDPDELWNHIQNINLYTHGMEGYTYPLLNRRKAYKNKEQICLLHTTASTVEHAPQVFSPENIKWIENYSFDFLIEDYRHTVWLHEEITGKDQMKAWLDHDALNQFDITGNKFMTPSITLDPEMIYASILDNPQFRKESITTGKKLNRYPLGDITNQEEITNWEEIRFSKILSIDLDDKQVWSNDA